MLTFLRPFGGKAERRYVSRSLCPVGVKYEFCLFVVTCWPIAIVEDRVWRGNEENVLLGLR